MVPELGAFLQRWGTGPLTIYVGGIFLPLVVALVRSELMTVIGVPLYALLFWAGPFVSAAAVIWTAWSAIWRAAWILLVPVFAGAALGFVFAVWP